jgi:hypothetical protein
VRAGKHTRDDVVCAQYDIDLQQPSVQHDWVTCKFNKAHR